jgi:hypothetical protein
MSPPSDNNALSGKETLVLISQRATALPGEQLIAYRISNTVYMELKE